ncbi:MAG: spore maturation protein [Lachnospiraceae bacterium]|nr:spore maturation protein [Lachnospiraceae bacterium]
MRFLLYLSGIMIPFTVFYIVGCGMLSKVPVYDSFIKGAKSGFGTVIRLAPTLIGLMTATGVLRASGFLDAAAGVIGEILPDEIFPSALVPLAIIRIFSSGAANGLLLDIYSQYGTDSLTGMTASLLMCCTETVFYTMSVYYTSVGIKKTRHTLCGALIALLSGTAACVWLARRMV